MRIVSERRYEKELEKMRYECERERWQSERFDRIEKQLYEMQTEIEKLKAKLEEKYQPGRVAFEVPLEGNCDRRGD